MSVTQGASIVKLSANIATILFGIVILVQLLLAARKLERVLAREEQDRPPAAGARVGPAAAVGVDRGRR